MRNKFIQLFLIFNLLLLRTLCAGDSVQNPIDGNVTPIVVRELMMEYQKTNSDRISPFSSIEDQSLRIMGLGGGVWGEGYRSYSFSYDYGGEEYRVNFLYDEKNGKAYIVNDDRYSPEKISLLFRNLKISLQNIDFYRIEMLAYYIGKNYAPMLVHVGTNEMYHTDIEPRWYYPIILPNALTEKQIKESFFYPELKIIQNDKLRWELKFLVYLKNGSIYEYRAKGDFAEDGTFQLEKIAKEELYPKNSVKVVFPGIREVRPDAMDAYFKNLYEEEENEDNDE